MMKNRDDCINKKREYKSPVSGMKGKDITTEPTDIKSIVRKY